jgi:hypothetical protein
LFGRVSAPIAEVYEVAAAARGVRGDAGGGDSEMNCVVEMIGESVGKSLNAGFKSGEGVGSGGFFSGANDSAEDAAVRGLGFVELRKGAAKGEFFWIAGVDSGDEWADEFVEEFGGEFPAHKVSDGFVAESIGRRGFGVTKEIAEDAEFRAGAEERTGEKGWRAEGCRNELAVEKQETRELGRRGQKFGRNIQVADELREGIGDGEALRAEFEEKILVEEGLDYAAGTVRRFE